MQNLKSTTGHQALSVFGRRKYERLIASFRKHSKGETYLQNEDLECLLRSNGLCPTLAEIASAMREISKSGGLCSVNMFLDIAVQCARVSSSTGMTDMLEFFALYDPMNQGYIDPLIFREIMTKCGERFSDSTFEEVIGAFSDTQSRNMVNYRKFITTITSV